MNFYHNWATDELDLLCKPVSSYNFICSVYFICFTIGIVFFITPDLFGRRKIMISTLVIYCIGCYLSTYYADIRTKTLGYAIIGWFHVKVTTCFVQLTELVPDNSKVFALTIISCFDSVTMGLVSAIIFAGYSYQ